MIKKLTMILSSLVLVFGLSACASDYVMTTNTGQIIISHGKPVLDKETGMTSYVDQDGNEHQIKSDEISEMVEK